MASNVERLREMYVRFWEERDWDAGRDVLSDDVEWIGMDEAGLGDLRRGRSAIRDFFREWLEAWEVSSNPFEIEEITPDLILVASHFRGRGRASGIDVELHIGQVYEFENGMVVRQTMYRTYDEARRAVDVLVQADAG